MFRCAAGFTIVELVVVIVLLGIIATYVAPKFSGRDGYSELTVQQELKQSIRFAQQLAMSRTDRTIAVVTSATQIDIQEDGAVLNTYSKTLPGDVPLGNFTLTFDRFGSAGSGITTIPVKGAFNVCVVGATGYAHDC